MTANVRQEMLYPVVGYTRLKEGGPLIMLGWIFVSDDLSHDFHQVRTGDTSDIDSLELSFLKLYAFIQKPFLSGIMDH